jgi:hypothetical protein
VFREAINRWPAIRSGWHASGPGRTHEAIRGELGAVDRAGVWLDRASWEKDICL